MTTITDRTTTFFNNSSQHRTAFIHDVVDSEANARAFVDAVQDIIIKTPMRRDAAIHIVAAMHDAAVGAGSTPEVTDILKQGMRMTRDYTNGGRIKSHIHGSFFNDDAGDRFDHGYSPFRGLGPL